MAMGQQKDRQGDLMVSWSEMPRSPGHVFYDRLQLVLIEGGFDGFAEAVCQPYYAARMGAPSVPPGRYFRMHLVGYFEGIDSERGLEWRCSDSLSLREFLLLEMRERVPDHSWLSRTRARLPHEVHTAVFDWVLALIAEAGLVKGERIGVDASTMEANAALRNIVRRDTGEGYRGMLERLAQESGIETPTAEDLARLDRKRKGKKLSNQDWVSRSDPEAKIAKMKDGTTHLAYKPEHAVDLDTGAVVAAELHPADEGDTTTLPKTLAAAEANLEAVDVAPTAEDPAECVTDKGYHSRLVLKALDDGPWKSRISEPKQKGFARWHGDDAARRAVTNNRTRLLSGVAREAFKLRAEIVERSFAHNLDRGGMRRTWLRGRENVHKRYLLHVAGHNLSLLMRQLIGAGTPKEAVAGGIGALFVLVTPAGAVLVVQIVLIVSEDGETAFAANRLCTSFRPDQHVVGEGLGAHGDAEQRAEGGVACPAPVEAEHELVEIALQVLGAQPVIDAARPALEIGEHLMDPGQHEVGGHGTDDVGIVGLDGGRGVAGPAVGLGGAGGGDVVADEAVEAFGAVGRDLGQAQAARRVAVADLDGADDEQLAVVAAPGAAGHGIILGAERQRGLVDLDEARQRVALGIDHGFAQLGGEQPGAAIRTDPELVLELQRRDPVRMRRHQVGGPEPDGERELAAVQDGPRRHRGLAMAARALERVGLAA